ncbi:pyrimidine utilization protein A [Acidisphaera sp. L21]|jgi:pyrimidine oxygenase|uniref:pyrimidine utilization protein A n=1 Tax=Acidisphaera sp. L21 TaxID=1641851 RepID=UPI00131C966F|nr:pyrimidine utilization protein A [Acidisphaera sp. L21]
MQLGVFLPIGNNGWLISTTSPQYMPSFELNRTVVEKAEKFGFDFALSMIKLRGFGGPSEFWDHNLESFTMMAGLAAVTSRIQLFATIGVLTMPAPIVARMAVTIDSISNGRFGVNVISGWQEKEYSQMGIWPGDAHYQRRYEYCEEYVTIMKELWATGHSDFKGEFFQMDDCRCSPLPSRQIPIVCAGQSDRGTKFAAEYADFNFVASTAFNDPCTIAGPVARLVAKNAELGTKCGALVLLMIIADETDDAALAKWEHYKTGTDYEAMAYRDGQASNDKQADVNSTVDRFAKTTKARLPTAQSVLCGSYAKIAALLDDLAAVPGVQGAMLTFDDFVIGMEQFGTRIQPLMKSRQQALSQAA